MRKIGMTPTGSTMANSAKADLTSARMSMPCIIAAWRSGSSGPAEHQVPHPVSEADAALLEFGERAGVGARRVVSHGIGEQRFGGEHRQHLLGVVLPVGGQVDVAARLQPTGEQRHQRRLDQAALMVALLVPGVGKEDMDAGE